MDDYPQHDSGAILLFFAFLALFALFV